MHRVTGSELDSFIPAVPDGSRTIHVWKFSQVEAIVPQLKLPDYAKGEVFVNFAWEDLQMLPPVTNLFRTLDAGTGRDILFCVT